MGAEEAGQLPVGWAFVWFELLIGLAGDEAQLVHDQAAAFPKGGVGAWGVWRMVGQQHQQVGGGEGDGPLVVQATGCDLVAAR